MVKESEGGIASDSRAILIRHWPAFLFAAILAICLLLWLVIPKNPAQRFIQLVEATLPNIVAIVLTTLIVYLVLNRDVIRASVRVRAEGVEPRRVVDNLQELDTKIHELSEVVGSRIAPSVLRPRSSLPNIRELLEGADDIGIVAASGLGLINRNYGLFRDRLGAGTKMTVVLLDPEASEAMTIWDRLSNPPMSDAARDIRQGINLFKQLEQEHGPRCVVLLTDVVPPYSLLCAFDSFGGGRIQAESFLFREPPDKRPHVLVASTETSPWFALYRSQFESHVRYAQTHVTPRVAGSDTP